MTHKKKPRIGFHVMDDVDEPEPEVGAVDIKELLRMLYQPNGFTEHKDFKTAVEITYELSEIIEVSTKEVSAAMTELGFEFTTIDNHVCFIVFQKNNDDD